MRTPTTSSRPVRSRLRPLGVAGTLALAVACLLPRVVLAQSASGFVGNWVEDPSKRSIGSLRNLTFRPGANGGLEELRGPSARPVVEPVHFDGKPYDIDGSRNTIIWKQLDATHFERTISQNGQWLNTRRLQVSADGTTLTEALETTDDGKKTVATVVYRRTSGKGSGLAGVWKPQSYKSDLPFTVRIEAVANGLRVFMNERRLTSRTTLTWTFDGKPAPVEGGPAQISGGATAAKLVNDRTIEIAQSRENVPVGRATWSLAQDGKTLTQSSTSIGPDATNAPSVLVFSRR